MNTKYELPDKVVEGLSQEGFAMIEGVLSAEAVSNLIAVVGDLVDADRRRGGVRNLLEVPEMRSLAQGRSVLELVESTLGSGARVVRGILFDKTDGANWKVRRGIRM